MEARDKWACAGRRGRQNLSARIDVSSGARRARARDVYGKIYNIARELTGIHVRFGRKRRPIRMMEGSNSRRGGAACERGFPQVPGEHSRRCTWLRKRVASCNAAGGGARRARPCPELYYCSLARAESSQRVAAEESRGRDAGRARDREHVSG